MDLNVNYIGNTIIELQVKSNDVLITECITNLEGFVDENFIIQLRGLADDLEEYNNLNK